MRGKVNPATLILAYILFCLTAWAGAIYFATKVVRAAGGVCV